MRLRVEWDRIVPWLEKHELKVFLALFAVLVIIGWCSL